MTCIYCQSQRATTRDHVPPKELLRQPYPRNLLTVPSCVECNESYSIDEEYFRLTIVGLLCHTTEAESLFDVPLSRSMSRRPSLEDLMFGSLSPHADGVVLDVDYARIYRVGDKIARGLCFAVSGLLPPPRRCYSIAFAEVETMSSIQTFGPDFTYAIHDSSARRLEFTLYQSVRFDMSRTLGSFDHGADL